MKTFSELFKNSTKIFLRRAHDSSKQTAPSARRRKKEVIVLGTLALTMIAYACNNTKEPVAPVKTFEQVAAEYNIKLVNRSAIQIDPRLDFKTPDEVENFLKTIKDINFTVSGVAPLPKSQARIGADGRNGVEINLKNGVVTGPVVNNAPPADGEELYGRAVISQQIGFMSRNVAITWGRDFGDSPSSVSYYSGLTMGAGFNQTGQFTSYNSSTGNFQYTIWGVQTYSFGMGPVQGGMADQPIVVTGTYNPKTGAYTMTSRNDVK